MRSWGQLVTHFASEVRSATRSGTAREEGLEAKVDPASTAVQGWFPDQAAVSGMLAKIRLLGLELIELRRLPQSR